MRLLLAALALLSAQAHAVWAEERTRYLYLLPEGFAGWVCVDFGVAGAPPLPREGQLLLIRPEIGGVLRTSDPSDLMPPLGDAFVESEGRRRPLPDGVDARKTSGHSNTNRPVVRHCTFFGDEDAADAAGPAPGADDSGLARRISAGERQALVALYEATNGPRWKHRVGWLGPPGTECSWHGVGCDLRADEPTVVKSLDLFENDLVGSVPEAIGQLEHLDSLLLFGNRLSGPLPQSVVQRWLEGALDISADSSQMTDVSEVDLESELPSLLCGQRRIVLRSDRTATVYAKRCRQSTPDDRSTYCEVKRGRLFPREFARLGVLLERDGFFRLKPEYSRLIIDAGGEVLRVTRAGVVHQVRNFATDGPLELWSIERAVEGVAANAEWESTTEEPDCPRAGAASSSR